MLICKELGNHRHGDRRSARRHDRMWRVVTTVLWLAVLAISGQTSLAQTELYKCTDGRNITYSSSGCETIGLKSAGPVRDRLTVVPGGQPASKPAPPQVKSNAADEERRANKDASTTRPGNPLNQKLLN